MEEPSPYPRPMLAILHDASREREREMGDRYPSQVSSYEDPIGIAVGRGEGLVAPAKGARFGPFCPLEVPYTNDTRTTPHYAFHNKGGERIALRHFATLCLAAPPPSEGEGSDPAPKHRGGGVAWGSMSMGHRDLPILLLGSVVLGKNCEGPPGRGQGGAVATVLDTLLGHVARANQRPIVTANLKVDYYLSAPLGEEMACFAWIEGEEGRKIYVRAQICSGVSFSLGKSGGEEGGPRCYVDGEGGRVVAEATALMVVPKTSSKVSYSSTLLPPSQIPRSKL